VNIIQFSMENDVMSYMLGLPPMGPVTFDASDVGRLIYLQTNKTM